MGRIFSYEEITSEHGLPTSETFETTLQVYSELVEDGVQDGWLDGAMVYGSVVFGTANARSDFDAFLSITDDTPETLSAAQQLINATVDSSVGTIPLRPNIHPRQTLETGMHDIDRLFGRHLVGASRRVYGSDPADYITFAQTPARDILANYLLYKRCHLTSSYTSSSPLDFREGNGIQRMLELPAAIGRKLLAAFEEGGVIGEQPEMGANKKVMLARMRPLLVEENAEEGFDELVELDKLYSGLLHETAEGCVTKETYEREIHGLHAKMPVAITWLSQLEQNLLVKVDDRAELAQAS